MESLPVLQKLKCRFLTSSRANQIFIEALHVPIKISLNRSRGQAYVGLTLMLRLHAFGQGKGRLTGRVLASERAGGGGVVVVATNQITGTATRTAPAPMAPLDASFRGRYALRSRRHYAKFEKGGKFGDFALRAANTLRTCSSRRVKTAARHPAQRPEEGTQLPSRPWRWPMAETATARRTARLREPQRRIRAADAARSPRRA